MENSPGQIGELATIAFAADNPGSSIVVQPWGKWFRPGLAALAGAIALSSLAVFFMRSS